MISQPVLRVALFVLLAAGGLVGCAWEPPHTATPGSAVVQDPASRAASVAYEQVGTPYRFGGNSPAGFDCSGLVQYAYARAGITVPRTTTALWHSTPVARDQMRAGDVLFFDIEGKMSHVGMYLGEQRFVHAPSSGKTVSVGTLASPYYARAFIRAGRLD